MVTYGRWKKNLSRAATIELSPIGNLSYSLHDRVGIYSVPLDFFLKKKHDP
jgi:hypothetical protein